MHKFVRSLITEWRRLKLPTNDATIVVAVSGGADSAALLGSICELKRRKKLDLRILAADFDHGLREDSEADQMFVAELSQRFGAEFVSEKGQLPKRGNLEQNARAARYEFLRRIIDENGAAMILTGHTLNDQAETLLMNLIRGSGPEGLGGMHTVRPLREILEPNDSPNIKLSALLSSPLLVRPMLRWAKRADTVDYCIGNAIEFRHDTMNDDLAFTRVRIRKILIPVLEQFNPRIVETLSATAGLMPGIGSQTAGGTELPEDMPSLSDLKAMEKPDLYSFLRNWLKSKRENVRRLDLKHIEAVERLIHSRKSGTTVELPRGQTVSKLRGRLVFKRVMVEK